MSDNVLQTLQQLVQDVIAPDVRELKVRLSGFEKQMDLRFDAVDLRFAAVEKRFTQIDDKFHALEQRMDMQLKAILAAISESKAQSDLTTFRLISALSERVAVLEAQRH